MALLTKMFKTSFRPLPWCTMTVATLALACSSTGDEEGSSDSTGTGGGQSDGAGGDASSGSGGTPSDAGATGGGPSSSGGASSGGTSTGGTPSGGTSSGGMSSGGMSSGGMSSGGMSSGGAPGTSDGGSPSGGASTGDGGTSSGGSNPGDESSYYLSDLCTSGEPVNGWGPIERDLSNGEDAARDGGPITIDHTVYSKGIGVHAPAEMVFSLGGSCSALEATLGIDDEMRASGSVVFEVWGDGEMLYQSGTLTGADAGEIIAVDVTAVQQLRLVTSDDGGNGSDHADWADARVNCVAPPADDCAATDPPIVAPDGYELVWSDEFDQPGAPSSDNWSFEQGFVRNEELQWYQSENAWVQAGFLIIEGRREQVPNPNYEAGSGDWKRSREFADYTSSALHSRGKRSFQYGRFEMRGRIVTENGLWPAFWTLGNNGEWPSNGEVDVLEFYGGAIHANFAWGTETRWQAAWDSVQQPVSSFGDDDWDIKFHVWALEWDENSMVLTMDGQEMNSGTVTNMQNPDGGLPFRQPHYILLNLAIGGAGGDPSGTVFPSRYEIDYVRVFQ